MSHHTAYTLAALCVVGGIAGYWSKKSTPSLVAGVGLGCTYGVAGYLIAEKQVHFYGHLLAGVSSLVLISSGATHLPKPETSKTLPAILIGIGALSAMYEFSKVWEWRDE